MKRIVCMLCALALAVGLTACSGGSSKDAAASDFSLDLTQAIVDSGAFSDELDPLDCDTAWNLYKFEQAGLTRDQLTDCAILRSAGATCEEVAVLLFADSDAAQSAKTAVQDYVQSQIDANTDYRPAEIPKLENALVEQKGASLLLVVANEMDAVTSLLNG